MAPIRFYRIALAASLSLNLLLVGAIWAYFHFEAMWSLIETAVGILG